MMGFFTEVSNDRTDQLSDIDTENNKRREYGEELPPQETDRGQQYARTFC